MTLKLGISTRKPEEEYQRLEIDGQKLEAMRGGEEEKVIEIKELLESLNKEIGGYIDEPCNVTIEINGTTSYQAGGGLKALIFEVGGNAQKTNGVKLVLNLKISPKKQ